MHVISFLCVHKLFSSFPTIYGTCENFKNMRYTDIRMTKMSIFVKIEKQMFKTKLLLSSYLSKLIYKGYSVI